MKPKFLDKGLVVVVRIGELDFKIICSKLWIYHPVLFLRKEEKCYSNLLLSLLYLTLKVRNIRSILGVASI